MTKRTISEVVRGQSAIDGAGVHLRRVLGLRTIESFDPFLMLDGFDSLNPEDYIKGFPWHPHRGIETVTYLLKAEIEHSDNLGKEENAKIDILSGVYQGHKGGHDSEYQKVQYFDVILKPNSVWKYKKTPNDQTLFLYLIQGTLAANDALNQFEEKAWGDPIVMNTKEELNHAFEELRNHSFIKHG